MIVEDDVKTLLAQLPNTEFLPVIFERLVDVPLPVLGDFSWYERITTPPGADPDYELSSKPNVPSFHHSVEHYWEVLCANLYELDSKPADAELVEIDFGSYGGEPRKEVLVSVSLLEEYPFVWSSITQLREDAFAIIAPFLDLDYFSIAHHYIDTDDGQSSDDNEDDE